MITIKDDNNNNNNSDDKNNRKPVCPKQARQVTGNHSHYPTGGREHLKKCRVAVLHYRKLSLFIT